MGNHCAAFTYKACTRGSTGDWPRSLSFGPCMKEEQLDSPLVEGNAQKPGRGYKRCLMHAPWRERARNFPARCAHRRIRYTGLRCYSYSYSESDTLYTSTKYTYVLPKRDLLWHYKIKIKTRIYSTVAIKPVSAINLKNAS